MSFRTECFKCHKNYNSKDPNDEGGVDFCPRCRKESKVIARAVDEQMAKKPKRIPTPKMKPFQTSPDGRLEIYNARQLLLND